MSIKTVTIRMLHLPILAQQQSQQSHEQNNSKKFCWSKRLPRSQRPPSPPMKWGTRGINPLDVGAPCEVVVEPFFALLPHE